MILGVAQDAGIPQILCNKTCCAKRFGDDAKREFVTSLAVFDRNEGNYWLFEASPDIKYQLSKVNKIMRNDAQKLPEGIFLTHAHMGHYTGLMHLGKEAISSRGLSVYAMPRLKEFLSKNGPWSQLVDLENIVINEISADSSIKLNGSVQVKAIEVPHRDEFSETVGYSIKADRSVLFIPDIDKWEKWDRNIIELIRSHDIVFIDGTFFSATELPGRNMNEIPHPFIVESMKLFNDLSLEQKNKIHFIHFNHSNPVYESYSKERKTVIDKGFRVAETGQVESLYF
ncbi:MAG: pyrroloquinoline quinone biosynthesis protein PqqB [Bacteroidia bacterium]|nr:pyrroloquinoline quinone biosynthesis protein PqqB [Bacteroidia bacterium]